jgi:hypothetical protein
MILKKITYQGWKNSWLLKHAGLELVAVAAVGPRILRLAREGGENIFKEFAGDRGKSGGDRYRAYGGHRLWSAPEIRPVTYRPDNDPAKAVATKDSLRLIQKPDERTGLAKEFTISASATGFKVLHRLGNVGGRPIEAAAWAITMLREGGTAEVAFPPPSGLRGVPRPSAHLVWWRYTRLKDRRLSLLDGSYRLKSGKREWPLKVGSWCPEGLIRYHLGRETFTKKFAAPEGKYPDYGCNVEVFTQGEIMEVESLSRLKTLRKGQAILHAEEWSLERR